MKLPRPVQIGFESAKANAVRTAHHPFSPEFYALCDEMGILVLAELLDDWNQVGGFVFAIARNYRIDLLRKQAREMLEPEIFDAGSYQTDFESTDEAAEIRRRVNAALATLPPTLREAFALFRLAELSIREIARQTNTTEANVKVRIHRATAKMREALGGVEGER